MGGTGGSMIKNIIQNIHKNSVPIIITKKYDSFQVHITQNKGVSFNAELLIGNLDKNTNIVQDYICFLEGNIYNWWGKNTIRKKRQVELGDYDLSRYRDGVYQESDEEDSMQY